MNLGYVYENIVSQQLVCAGNTLFYYTMQSETSHHLYEVDFLISRQNKICPIEVKSSNYRNHNSLDFFAKKYASRIAQKYVIHTKNFKVENNVIYLPVYMASFL